MPPDPAAPPAELPEVPTSPEPTPPTELPTESVVGGPAEPEAPKPDEPPKPEEPKAPTLSSLKIEDFTAPEGTTLDPERFKGFQEAVPELSKETAQKLLELHAKELKAAEMVSTNVWMETQKQWATEASKDTEFGGDKLPETKANIAKVIDQFSKTPEEAKALRHALVLTGAGNNPAIVRFWARAAKALTEGRTVTGSPGGAPRSAAASLYPNLPSADQGV